MSESTRIFVQNIPTYATEKDLKKYFSKVGTVTATRIVNNDQGRSRGFGFVGFQDAATASAAIAKLNGAFYDRRKLIVKAPLPKGSAAASADDENRPWSKYSKGSSRYNKIHNITPEKKTKSDHKKLSSKYSERLKAKLGSSSKYDTELGLIKQLENPDEELSAFLSLSKAGTSFDNDPNFNGLTPQDHSSVRTKRGRESQSLNAPDSKKRKSNKTKAGSKTADNTSSSDEEIEFTPKNASQIGDSDSDDWNTSDSDSDQEGKTLKKPKNNSKKQQNTHESSSGSDSDSDFTVHGASDPKKPFDSDSRSKSLKKNSVSDDDEPTSENNQEENPSKSARVKRFTEFGADDISIKQISKTGRLFIRNLPYTATPPQIHQKFSKFGKLSEFYLLRDRKTNASIGLCYITYMLPKNAVEAYKALDGKDFQGRLIHIIPSDKQESKTGKFPSASSILSQDGDVPESASARFQTMRELANSKFQLQKLEKLSSFSKSLDYDWRGLFINQDSIVTWICNRLNIDKSEFFSSGSGSGSKTIASKIAIAEADLIQNIKQWLITNNVNMDSFAISDEPVNKALSINPFLENVGVPLAGKPKLDFSNDKMSKKYSKRKRNFTQLVSKTVLILKNISPSVDVDSLKAKFAKYGPITKFLIPEAPLFPAIGIIEYQNPGDATRAFKKMDYAIIKGTPLYIQWAPESIFDLPKSSSTSSSGLPGEEEEDVKDEPITVIFIKNLPFETTDEQLKTEFEGAGAPPIKRAGIHTRLNPFSKEREPSGSGYVEFHTPADASLFYTTFHNYAIKGRPITLALSLEEKERNKTFEADVTSKKQSAGISDTKLIIKNIPFEATFQDLEDIFTSLGTAVNIKLPRKADGSIRGFAFVDFVSSKEANNAIAKFKNIHLLGRKLALARAYK